MVRVRVADPEVFVAAATDRGRRAAVARYRDHLLESGASRPEWCLVAERDGLVLGRIALWSLPGATRPSDFVLLDLDWHGTDADRVGDALVRAALDAAARSGAERLQHVLDRPAQAPQWQEHPDRRRRLLERHGFVLQRTTLRFEYVAATAPRPAPSGPLRFRSLVDVGEPQFRDVLAEVTRGSLDPYDRAGVAAAGRKRYAARLYAEVAGLEFSPAWWELAYDAAGEVVGVSMPARAPGAAVIGYIGVVPAHRGRGHIDHLLARATSVLLDAGAPVVRADTSVENQPMARAFERAGYRTFATRQEFSAALRPRARRRRRPERVEGAP